MYYFCLKSVTSIAVFSTVNEYVYSDAYGGPPVSGFSEPNSQDQNLRNRTSHCMCWPKFLGADARLMRTMVPYQDSLKINNLTRGTTELVQNFRL